MARKTYTRKAAPKRRAPKKRASKPKTLRQKRSASKSRNIPATDKHMKAFTYYFGKAAYDRGEEE